MFLRATKRFKDGKEHRYWSVVENRRVSAKQTVQKTLLYLGEINDTECASWTRAIESVDESNKSTQINLFPEDRAPNPALKDPSIQLKLSQIELSRPRQWGACWLALELWDHLQLDAFWEPSFTVVTICSSSTRVNSSPTCVNAGSISLMPSSISCSTTSPEKTF